MTASNQEAIAKHVWPEYQWRVASNNSGVFGSGAGLVPKRVNLLETDSDGNPTQQAKASALDEACWIKREFEKFICTHDEWATSPLHAAVIAVDDALGEDNPCAAIYKAACEVLGLEIEDAK